jgi:hypothetical protein
MPMDLEPIQMTDAIEKAILRCVRDNPGKPAKRIRILLGDLKNLRKKQINKVLFAAEKAGTVKREATDGAPNWFPVAKDEQPQPEGPSGDEDYGNDTPPEVQ